MKDYTLTEQFALVALNGQDCKHDTASKKAAVMGIAAAKTLENLLEENAQEDISKFKAHLDEMIEYIKKIHHKERLVIEKEISDILKTKGILTEIPNLLGCDLYYYTSNITMREYKSAEGVYQSITEEIRAVVLEPGDITEDIFCLVWLLRESGCLHDLFSSQEQKQMQERIVDGAGNNPLYQVIWEHEFHSGIVNTYVRFVSAKHNLFKNPYLEGINLLFPFLDRRQAIFIDMVIAGKTVKERRRTAMEFLEKCGHTCEEVQMESETFLKIDNGYYRIWPATRSCRFPIQGVELLPVYK